jgi:hypothetical protein
MKRIKQAFFIIFWALIFNSCLYEHATIDPSVTPIDTTNTDPTGGINCDQTAVSNTKDSVCFNSQILPFFVTNCAQSGCHDAKTRAEGYDLSTFQKITSKGIDKKNPSNSKLYREMLGNMPPKPAPRLPKEQTDMVLKWITEGAKNVICGSAIDTTNVTFSKTINPLLQTNCVGCHKAGSVSGGVLLDSYANIKTYIDNKKIWGAINYISGYVAMPPSQKMNDCQLKVIKKWIDNGAKND